MTRYGGEVHGLYWSMVRFLDSTDSDARFSSCPGCGRGCFEGLRACESCASYAAHALAQTKARRKGAAQQIISRYL